jgi:hypothetical protein
MFAGVPGKRQKMDAAVRKEIGNAKKIGLDLSNTDMASSWRVLAMSWSGRY